jgi:predicted esterase
MIMLHGTGGGFAYFEGWISACRKKGYVVVTPESSGCGTPASGNSSNDDQKRWDSVDIPNVIGLVKEVMNKYNVDRRRVCIMGFSNGAFYATRIGLGAPELFQSVVCIAGGIGGKGWTDKSRDMGVYIIHGTADTSVPVDKGKSLADQLKADGFKNVICREFPGRDHETFPEEAEPCLKWLEPQKKPFTPGSNETLDWQTPEKGLESLKAEGKMGLMYFFGAKDGESDLAINAELGIFAEAQVIEAAKDLVCIKVDREKSADLVKQFAVKGPAILLVDSSLRVAERIDKWCTPADFLARMKKTGK